MLKHAVTINLSPNDEMTITPVTPCYMKPAGCARWQSLELGSSVPIKPGDVCSLLPDKCWFKIISVSDTMQEGDQALKRKIDQEDSNNEADSKKACLLSSMEAVVSPSETSDSVFDKNLPDEYKNCPVNGNGEHGDAAVPVSQIHPASSPEEKDMSTSSKMSTDSQDVTEPPVEHEEEHSNRKRKAKNINSNKATTNGEPSKKIKWDCDEHFSDQIEAAPPNNPSSPEVAAPQDQASASNPDRVPREQCLYGARCYRKNPNHKNNYSHPEDSDYDEVDDRQECPYGVKCYRKNPQHKTQFKHTATGPRPRRRAATPVHTVVVDNTSDTDASSMESVDESEYEPSVYTESSDEWDNRSELEDDITG